MVALNGRMIKGAPKGNVVARESPYEEFVYDIIINYWKHLFVTYLQPTWVPWRLLLEIVKRHIQRRGLKMKHLLGSTALLPIFSSSALAKAIVLQECSHLDSTMAPHW